MLPILKEQYRTDTRIKASLVVSILNSHEIVRRHILYYQKMPLPNDVEIIYMDDGSDPPLDFSDMDINFNLSLYATNDFRKWTQPAAENAGARRAVGDFLIMTDIDCILSRELINVARNCPIDVVRFQRYAGILDENGNLTQNTDILRKYGLRQKYIDRGLKMSVHGNSYIIRRSLFLDVGGVDERYSGTGKYPNRQEAMLKRKLHRLAAKGEIKMYSDNLEPPIYMFPVGRYGGSKDFNPYNLFHTLTRYTNKQRRRMREAK